MKNRVEGFVLALVIAGIFTIVAITAGARALVNRVRRVRRHRAELTRRRRRVAQSSFGRSDLDLVRVVGRELGHEATAREVYAACYERIRDTEGPDQPSLRRTRALSLLVNSEIIASQRAPWPEAS